MRIEKFLEKINYKIKSGEIYKGKDLKNNLLYWINFMDKKELYKGRLLVSAKNQMIYLIEYNVENKIYLYKTKEIEYESSNKIVISLNKLLNLIK